MTVTDAATAFLADPVDRTRVPAAIGPRPQPGALGVEGTLVLPGSDEWFTTISASKVSAVTGTSAYDSPYSLWRRMKGHVEPEGDDDVKSAGRYEEPGIVNWLRDQHPDLRIRPCGTFTSAANDRHTAAPDRVAVHDDGTIDLVEIKTSRKPETWGQPGTDQIPVDYRDQVDWQLHCTGAPRCWIAVKWPWFDYGLYVVDRDQARIDALVQQVDAFLALLDAGTCPPPDGHKATHEAQQIVYRDIDDSAGVDFEVDVVRRFVEAHLALTEATTAELAARTPIIEALAGKRNARFGGRVFAEWKKWNAASKKPKLYVKQLPDLGDLPRVEVIEQPAASAPAGAPELEQGSNPAATTAWIVGRLRAIRDSGNTKALDAVRQFWPTDVPTTGPWTDPQIDAINALLVQVETVDEVPYPPGDPRIPPAEPPAPEPLPDTLARRNVHDRTAPASAADAADLKASIAPLLDAQVERLKGWQADAKRAKRPYKFVDGQATRRTAAINAAAIALVLHGVDGTDETVARFLIGHVTGKELGTQHVGIALGSLGLGEARDLVAATHRFAGGDPDLTQAVSDHLVATWT